MTPEPDSRWQQRLVKFSRDVEAIQQSCLPALERLMLGQHPEVLSANLPMWTWPWPVPW
jgi:hypothetical protein